MPRPSTFRWWRRLALLTLVSCAVFYGLGKWVGYRLSHVVTHQALVKGRISRVGSRIDGRVARIQVLPDQRVREGEILARFEDLHLQAAVRRSQAELARALKQYEAEQARLDADLTQARILVTRWEAEGAAVEAQLSAAEKRLARWERERDRMERVTLANVITASEREALLAQLESAEADVAAARARQRVAKLDYAAATAALEGMAARDQALAVLERDIDIARAGLEAAESQLEATVIRAPSDGWVADCHAETGTSLRIGDPVVSLWMGEDVWVEAWVEEHTLDDVRVGGEVDVTLNAYPDRVFRGRVEAMGVLSDWELNATVMAGQPVANPVMPARPRVGVRISLPRSDARIMPGLSAVVGIHTERDRLVISDIFAALRTVTTARL